MIKNTAFVFLITTLLFIQVPVNDYTSCSHGRPVMKRLHYKCLHSQSTQRDQATPLPINPDIYIHGYGRLLLFIFLLAAAPVFAANLLHSDLYSNTVHTEKSTATTIQNRSQTLTTHLQLIEPDNPAAIAANGYRFSPVQDYSFIEPKQLALNTHTYSEQLDFNRITGPAFRWGTLGLFLLLLTGVFLLLRQHRLNRSLSVTNNQLQQHQLILENLGESVYSINNKGNILFINNAALTMLGYNKDQMIGKKSHHLFHHSHSDGRHYPIEDCPVYRSLKDGNSRHVEDSFIRQNGTAFPVKLATKVITRKGVVDKVIVVFDDISQRQALQNEIKQQQLLLESVINATPDIIFFKDITGKYLGCNKAFEQSVGINLDQLIGLTDSDLVDHKGVHFFPANHNQVLARNSLQIDEESIASPDGSSKTLETIKTPFHDNTGAILGFVGISRDITERKQHEERITELAFYDPLTKLPNRRLLADRVDRALVKSRRQQQYGALMMIDLDDFKTINDTEGHDAGDQVLCTVADLLSGIIRESDTVARMGGDEFMMVLEDLGKEMPGARDNARDIAIQALQQLQAPHCINDKCYISTPSIGIVLFIYHGQDIGQLIKHADQAMYHAKRTGRNRFHFYSDLEDYMGENLRSKSPSAARPDNDLEPQ